MKKILYTLFLAALSLFSVAQCSKTYSGTGIYPSSLPTAWEQVLYIQELDFTFPADTLVNGFSVHIDSLKVKSLSGFPGTNFGYTCGNSNCKYLPNASAKFQGCFTISGTPPKGSAGNYKLYVELDAYIQTPFGAQIYTIQDSSVTFSVNACALVASITASDTMICVGANTTLTGLGAGTYKWFLNGNLKDSGTSVQTGLSGNWLAVLTDSVGCVDTSNIIQIGNHPAPLKPTITNMPGTNDLTCNISGSNYIWKANGVVDTLYDGKKTITVSKDGHYQVSYQDSNGCRSVWSDSVYFKYMGMGAVQKLQAYIFPNPAKDVLYIYSEGNSSALLQGEVFDLQGHSMVKFNGRGIQMEIPTSGLSNGMYILRLYSIPGQADVKFSIQR